MEEIINTMFWAFFFLFRPSLWKYNVSENFKSVCENHRDRKYDLFIKNVRELKLFIELFISQNFAAVKIFFR